MKREIRETTSPGVVQITSPDERFYARKINEGKEWDFVPSVTWIASYYPKGREFHRWLANQGGWSHAEEQKRLGGEKGSKVHQAARVLLEGGTVSLIDLFENPTAGEPEELSAAEYLCLMSLCDWHQTVKPQIISVEFTVWNERYRYAGTVDIYCIIQRTRWVIDLKVSPDIWPAHEIQVSAYKHASAEFPKSTRLGILQLGYKRNKNQKWKFTQVPDQFGLFLATRKIWEKETAGIKPFQRDYPESLSLNPVEATAEVAEEQLQ